MNLLVKCYYRDADREEDLSNLPWKKWEEDPDRTHKNFIQFRYLFEPEPVIESGVERNTGNG